MLDTHLRTFAAFARTLSYTKAADELRISQPVVSKQLSELAAQVGVPLVRRTGRTNTLTPAGAFLANHVLRAEATLDRALRELDAFRPSARGRLSLAASGTPGTYLLPAVLASFMAAEPGLDLHLFVGTAKDCAEAVRSHRADVGIAGAFDPTPDLESDVLLTDEIVIIGPPTLGASVHTVDQLEDLTWIGREEGTATNDAVDMLWRRLGISPSHRLTLPSREAVKLAVAAGTGIAATSRLAIDGELRNGSLCVLDVREWRLERLIYAIRPRGLPVTPTSERFLALARTLWRGMGLAVVQPQVPHPEDR